MFFNCILPQIKKIMLIQQYVSKKKKKGSAHGLPCCWASASLCFFQHLYPGMHASQMFTLSLSFLSHCYTEVSFSFWLQAFSFSLSFFSPALISNRHWLEMPANDIQLSKGYISPSAMLFVAVWPLTKPCLGIIALYSDKWTSCKTRTKGCPEVARRKRTEGMLQCHSHRGDESPSQRLQGESIQYIQCDI